MSITVVLTLYKRPQYLVEQIEAVLSQTIKPQKIILWVNRVPDIQIPEMSEELRKDLVIVDSSENFGVWARFGVALLANTKYVCVFDDDTIPGKEWFKNCLDTMKTHKGLLGTVGIIFNREDVYMDYRRYGWPSHNEKVVKVDIVGHAWFFKRKWLSHLWSFTPDYDQFHRCGEDMAFSYCLQKNGISTYVPPHPSSKPDMWGSNETKAMEYGRDENAVSLQPGATPSFERMYKFFINSGFKILNGNFNPARSGAI